ncbi:hypothetical protein V6Z11_A10G128800 [Gossypium hirsutum]
MYRDICFSFISNKNLLLPPLIILVTIVRDLLGFCIKCIEDSLVLDFGCGGFACGGKYGEIDVEAKLSNEMCMSPIVHPNDCGNDKALINYQLLLSSP